MAVRFVYSEGYEIPWPEHVFPAEKYRLVKDRLLAEGIARPEDISLAEPAPREALLRVHSAAYLDELEQLARAGLGSESVFEAPLDETVLGAVELAAGGTTLACRLALEDSGPHACLPSHRQAAMNLSGGFHHAFRDRGEGFCFVNDIAVGAADALAEGLARRVFVCDCDLHQGNGTARIFRDDARVFTFSIHEEDIYPVKEKGSLDIGLPAGAGDEEYVGLLEGALSRHLPEFAPELVIYQAGADPYLEDKLGSLCLTKDGLLKRDEVVFRIAREAGASVAVTLGGGYPERTEDVVDIHLGTARAMREVFGGGL